MKLGLVGKGGTGKTTLCTLVAMAYMGRGKRVVAVDTDSNPNMALSLGLDEAVADQAPLVPRALVVGSGDDALTPHQLLTDYGLPTRRGHAAARHAGEPARCRLQLRSSRLGPHPARCHTGKSPADANEPNQTGADHIPRGPPSQSLETGGKNVGGDLPADAPAGLLPAGPTNPLAPVRGATSGGTVGPVPVDMSHLSLAAADSGSRLAVGLEDCADVRQRSGSGARQRPP